MTSHLVWALKIPHRDDGAGLHEFGLSWYRLEKTIEGFEAKIRPGARPAMWIKIDRREEIERIQAMYADVKLGPADSFNEALIFIDNINQAGKIKERLRSAFDMKEGYEEMEALFREETMEDY